MKKIIYTNAFGEKLTVNQNGPIETDNFEYLNINTLDKTVHFRDGYININAFDVFNSAFRKRSAESALHCLINGLCVPRHCFAVYGY